MTAVWELEHSIDTDASQEAAWNYWSNVANWYDPPSEFELDGEFVAGARGITRTPGQPPMHWRIREVEPPVSAIIEMQLDGAVFTTQWRFAPIAGGRTMLTQRLELHGENAAVYMAQVDAVFRENLPAGMARIAARMAAGSGRESA